VTAGPDGKGIPIYIDPIAIQDVEKSLTSTIMIDFKGVPLRKGLHLYLKQLGLTYEINSGHLIITDEINSDAEVLPLFEPPFLIVGHCLLALIAAVFGGVTAPLISGRRERT
jgi:hypothetical protein